MADPDCLFCKIVAGDIPATKVHEDARTIAFMDINPATPGHLLCIPRAHAADLHEISTEDLCAVARTAKAMAGRVVERLGADGVNVMQSNGAPAWQTVFHYHVHVIPRYAGDPLRLPWTPDQGGDLDVIRTVAGKLAA
jgi:histidine triad (HIT) family protein